MTEPTEPQPTPTAPITPAAPSADPQGAAPSKTGPSRALLIAAIVFGLVGLGGVSFTAGYWTSELGGHRGGHAMHQKGPDGAQRHAPGRAEGPRMHRVSPTATPSATPTPAPTP